jgi:hypothetical protein
MARGRYFCFQRSWVSLDVLSLRLQRIIIDSSRHELFKVSLAVLLNPSFFRPLGILNSSTADNRSDTFFIHQRGLRVSVFNFVLDTVSKMFIYLCLPDIQVLYHRWTDRDKFGMEMAISHPRHIRLCPIYINVFPLPRDGISTPSRLRY